MISDKEQKKQFKEIASRNPERYYPTEVLKELGFHRKLCSCKMNFWTTNKDQNKCGDPSCQGGFFFHKQKLAKNYMTYIQVWQKFSKMFAEKGYKPLNRYPVVARWNPTMDFTIASIAAFQPHVVSGEMKPPADYITIPQFCLRFGDIDNVGITGSHMTGFVMIGQKCFVEAHKWDQKKVFRDICDWIFSGLGIDKKDVTFHEDAWAGGGNFGPCMEFFSGGVELGNQVYMMYEQIESGSKELKLKVLDMGMGMERNAWFSQGCATAYDAAFPDVMKKLRDITKIETNDEIMKEFVPYAASLNVDEAENIEEEWKKISRKIDVDVDILRKTILPSAALYSVAEHCRSLLFALNDGALPSNVGGGYNLRILIRRCLSFIDKFKWDIYLPYVCEWHAYELESLFPELKENLKLVRKILDVEKEKYESSKQKSEQIINNIILRNEEINDEKLLKLYDSDGISPHLLAEIAEKHGRKIKVADNFFALVASRHERGKQVHQTSNLDLDFKDVKEQESLYYDDYKMVEFDANVIYSRGKYIVLDKNYFYATSGGQLHDVGTIDGNKVIDVTRSGNKIVCVLENEREFNINEKVHCVIDWSRRKQLAQHHTATHIVNAAARRVLGEHANQAGAKKELDKAHIDITHYQAITDGELKEIEKEANKIVNSSIDMKLKFYPRDEAEEKFGKNIYQGGVAPGSLLRIVDIPGIDAEACGGTHLHNTSEAEEIRLIKSTKIQDGIVRITFAAGEAARNLDKKEGNILNDLAKELDVNEYEVPSRVNELFTKWKKSRKGKLEDSEKKLVVKEKFEGDALLESSRILKTPVEHLLKTVKRFKGEVDAN